MLDSNKPAIPRRDGRVAEGARLESVYTARYPGFESLSLRQRLGNLKMAGAIGIIGIDRRDASGAKGG